MGSFWPDLARFWVLEGQMRPEGWPVYPVRDPVNAFWTPDPGFREVL